MCIFFGFYVIVLVLLVEERILKDIIKLFDGILEDVVYEYMIIVVFKLEDDKVVLNELMDDYCNLIELNRKCDERFVIFGNNQEIILIESVEKFYDIFIEMIKKNSDFKKEFYIDRNVDDVMKIFKKD